MTLTSTTTYNSAAGNGTTLAFTYTFRCYATDELTVVERTDATGAEVTQTLTTDYTVTLEDDYDGGTVTFVAGNAPASGVTVYIISNVDNTQETDLVASGSIAAEVLETRLDRMQVQINEILAVLNRCIKVPVTENSATVEVDDSVNRADMYLKFDTSGDVTVSAT